MAEPKPWQSVVEVAILHPERAEVLVQRQEDGWRLPHLPLDRVWAGPLERVRAEVRALYALETTVLQQLAEVRDETDRLVYVLYLLAAERDSWQSTADLHWVGLAELRVLTFTQPAHQVAVDMRLAERAAGTTPAARVPWARPGWQPTAEAWIRAQMTALGYTLTGPIEQIKSWFLSCILRTPTTTDAVYFKVMNPSPLMVDEALATSVLAELFPAQMPTVLAIEPTQGWLLLADFGAEVGWSADVETRAEVLQAFGQLQAESATKVAQLLASGCLDRRLPVLAAQVDELLQDETMLAYVDPAQRLALQKAAPILKDFCAQLDQYNVPATLVHGDMHMSNVARTAHGYCFFDWSDACVAHPFLDMISVLHEPDSTVQQRLRDHYLAVWTAYEPWERLLAMWELAYPLCALHQAVSYRAILRNTEASCRYELAWAMPFWFGEILKSLNLVV
jgi:aminoglycoside/choline kinase family phosphotransferase